ncbi:NAD dependent epimerase/dehydratase [Colletotrichum gloeosporioides Cg-14]|uniref:NAD dependent epimerase/dehydratase n=1 Tax=Colletotrichum gloeosporioides (strain Cg-14) TaxID=1237896 RepID=T0L9P0_COLGC|nr:NAD dependent epimerase/dehydratase [Colletotrichum gloeosporioides Cg-14]
MDFNYILVTGATGLVGSHVVDNLLGKGYKVRAVARSKQKADAFLSARVQYASKLDFYFIDDLTDPGAFDEAVKDIDGVIHVASPLKYDIKDNENDLVIPALKGVRSILDASANSSVKRIVLTSSFGAVLDMGRDESTPWTYTANDWNPISYDEAVAPDATPQDAYRGSKTLAEQEAWRFVAEHKPHFDLVTLCPSMIFGPLATPPRSNDTLNESNMMLWRVATRGPSGSLPPCRFNFWIDVRDLAEIHAMALTTPQAGGKRYIPVAPEPFTYQKASETIRSTYPNLTQKIATGIQEVKTHVQVDPEPMMKDFQGLKYTSFEETVTDFMSQVKHLL